MSRILSRLSQQFSGFFTSPQRIRLAILVALTYAGISFAYSFIGFIHPQFGPHFHEYTFSRLATEIGGHFLFGLTAALPLLDFDLALVAGGSAVLIDSDHVLATLGFSVSGRPDHSIFYAIVSGFVLYAFGRALKLDGGRLAKLISVAPLVLSAHIAYDLFAGPNQEFQFYIPFSFQFQTLPSQVWVLFEALALIIAGIGFFISRRYCRN